MLEQHAVLLLSFCSISVSVESAFLNQSVRVRDVIFEKFSRTIINEYFLNDKCIVVVTDSNEYLRSAVLDMSIPYILISHEEVCDHPKLVDELIFAIDWCCSSYIIHVATPACVLKAWGEAQFSYNTPTLQRINPKIFALQLSESENGTFLDDLMNQLDIEVISNMVVAVIDPPNQDWPVEIYTNNFYERIDKPDREPKILLNRWHHESGFEKDVELYIGKTLDLKGKEIKVYVVDLLPYSLLSPFDGQEAELLKTFCAKHNCTIRGIQDEFFFGDVFENGTGGNGLLGLVYKGEADFGISGLYLLSGYFRNVDFSATYLQSGVTLLVGAPTRVGGWLLPFLPYNPEMWAAYVASVGATSVFMCLITRATIKYTRFAADVKKRGMFLTLMDAVFRSLGLSVLQQPSTPIVPHTPIRHLFTSFQILYLVLCTIYSAELASYLTSPQYTKPIDTLHDLATSGTIWVAEHSAYIYSMKDIEDPTIRTMVENFRVAPFDEQREMAKTGKYALLIERLAGGHFTKREFLEENIVAKLHLMSEYLYRSPLVTSIRKASPYTYHYNKLIGKLLSNGLLLYWEADASRKYFSSSLITALEGSRKLNAESKSRPLAFSDSIGIFLLYLGGISVSCITLIGEILVSKRRSKKIGQKGFELTL